MPDDYRQSLIHWSDLIPFAVILLLGGLRSLTFTDLIGKLNSDVLRAVGMPEDFVRLSTGKTLIRSVGWLAISAVVVIIAGAIWEL